MPLSPLKFLTCIHLSKNVSNQSIFYPPFSDQRKKQETCFPLKKQLYPSEKAFPSPKLFSKNLGSSISPIISLVKSSLASIFGFWLTLENTTQHMTGHPDKAAKPNKLKWLSWCEAIFLGTDPFSHRSRVPPAYLSPFCETFLLLYPP